MQSSSFTEEEVEEEGEEAAAAAEWVKQNEDVWSWRFFHDQFQQLREV